MKTRIGVTMGDPAGIGPEVILKTLCDHENIRKADICVIAHELTMFEYSKRLGISPIYREKASPADWTWRKVPFLVDPDPDLPFKVRPGDQTAEGGRLSFKALEEGFRLVREGFLDALVTSPISKAAWREAGLEYVGHTDYLSRATQSKAVMMMVGGRLRVSLVSVHVPLREAVESLNRDSIFETIRITHESLKSTFGFDAPRIAVAGLNPHSGEAGLLGAEETDFITPAIIDAVHRGWNVTGPVPPDVVFRNGAAGKYDAVVALYHDQGLIPVKLLAFEEAVNITLGIPIVRTSPGHGTAFDIAGRGLARPEGMAAAIRLAAQMRHRAAKSGGNDA